MKRYSIFTNKIKRYSLACFTMLCAMATFNSCHDDTFDSYGSGDGSEVNVKVFLTVPAPSIATRASSGEIDDSYYNQDGIYLLVFDGDTDNSNLLQIVQATGGSKIFYAKLKSRSDAHYVYIVANAEKIVRANQNMWESTSTKLGDIKKAIKYTLTTNKEGLLTQMVNPQPMMSKVYLENGIDASTKIGTSADDPIKMERSTVKISIYNDTAEGGLRTETLYGANLGNTPTEGYLFPMNDSDLSSITRTNTCGNDGSFETSIVEPAQGSTSCYLYSFESVQKDKKSTAVIIKATYLNQPYYYRIDLDTENSNYALVRNFNYIVHIQSIEQAGYATPEEALSNRAGNIKYIVSVTDAYSRDIVTNGEYYLGVENSEFYAYVDGALNDQLVSVVMHDAPSTVTPGSFTPSEGITITGGNNFPENKAGEQKVELRISTSDNFTNGSVKIQLGDLTRTIQIYKKPMTDRLGVLMTSFWKQGYISGKVNAANEDWIKLTDKEKTNGQAPDINDLKEEDLKNSLENADEKISIRVRSYTGDDSSPKFRMGTVDLFRKDMGGNARILIEQPLYNIYSEIVGQAKIAPYTYVGTFHRHNQTGERIIRVDTKISGGSVARWRVFVIAGDFIKLSTERSEDPGVGEKNFYGTATNGENADNTTIFGDDVERFQVKNGGIDFTKESSYIYFRVGLTSTIPANSVRYGLIGIQTNGDVGTTTVTRYIFVRQGEEADYLMRPQDAAVKEPGREDKSVELARRDKAVKFSPFNLTDPNANAVSGAPIHSDLTGKRGVFATYPSQAGYLYQALSKQGWVADPSIKHSVEGFVNSINGPWKEDLHETCPKGYRPDGGITGQATIDNVINSSVRQSLWLYPKNGGVNSTQNSIIGYIADGFYDRQKMWNDVTFSRIPSYSQPTAVNNSGQIAFIGVLAFNPSSLASLFMPMTGYYINLGGVSLRETGRMGSWWTKTPVYNNSSVFYSVDYGYMYGADRSDPDDYNFEKFRVDNYDVHTSDFGNNVRCVRQ